MIQSRRDSLIESITNIAIGYGVAVAAQMVLFPCFGVECSTGKNFGIGACFTVISLVRSYVLRRIFARRTD